MGMDRVQVVQAKRDATETARRNLCFMRSVERRSQVMTLDGLASSGGDPSSFGSGSTKLGSDMGPVTVLKGEGGGGSRGWQCHSVALAMEKSEEVRRN
ncbi:4-hydroxy-2-oxoheptanedioate aldolase [Sesbania bispinosa]|nr:4-hydroxy-2-oxoheptanedioate aldolase [Sesbania bispinosa]